MNYHGGAFSGTTLRTNGVTRPAVPLHPHEFPHVEVPEARLPLGGLVHSLVELVGDRVLGVARRRGEVGEGDQFDVRAGAVRSALVRAQRGVAARPMPCRHSSTRAPTRSRSRVWNSMSCRNTPAEGSSAGRGVLSRSLAAADDGPAPFLRLHAAAAPHDDGARAERGGG